MGLLSSFGGSLILSMILRMGFDVCWAFRDFATGRHSVLTLYTETVNRFNCKHIKKFSCFCYLVSTWKTDIVVVGLEDRQTKQVLLSNLLARL